MAVKLVVISVFVSGDNGIGNGDLGQTQIYFPGIITMGGISAMVLVLIAV